MANKEIINSKLKDSTYIIGCYDNTLEQLSKEELDKVIDRMFDDYTDVEVYVKNIPYIVEIATVGNEIDFSMISKDGYANKYGRAYGEA